MTNSDSIKLSKWALQVRVQEWSIGLSLELVEYEDSENPSKSKYKQNVDLK